MERRLPITHFRFELNGIPKPYMGPTNFLRGSRSVSVWYGMVRYGMQVRATLRSAVHSTDSTAGLGSLVLPSLSFRIFESHPGLFSLRRCDGATV